MSLLLFYFIIKKFKVLLGLVGQAFNPNTQEAEAVGGKEVKATLASSGSPRQAKGTQWDPFKKEGKAGQGFYAILFLSTSKIIIWLFSC